MLVLTRRVGETLIIKTADGIEIKVAVTGINGTQARLGIEAPKSVSVNREEVQQRIDQGVPHAKA